MGEEYSTDDLKDIFEIVNSDHLHLKGKEKAAAKRQLTTLNRKSKSTGAYDLYIALYESTEKYDKENEWFKSYMNDDENNASKNFILSKKPIPYVKHLRHRERYSKRIEDLENELDSVLEDHNLMSKKDHDLEMKELTKSLKQQLLECQDELQKAKNEIHNISSDVKAKLIMKEKIIEQLNKTITEFEKDKIN